MIAQLLKAAFVLFFLGLVLLLIAGFIQLFFIFIALSFLVWLVRQIPFVRRKMDEAIERKAQEAQERRQRQAEMFWRQYSGSGENEAKDVTKQVKIIDEKDEDQRRK